MTYLKGKDLRLKGDGHTLECWYDAIPKHIVAETNKIRAFSVQIKEDGTIEIEEQSTKKPEGFEKF